MWKVDMIGDKMTGHTFKQCGGSVVKFRLKVGQISNNLVKFGTFQDQISVHFGSVGKNLLKSDLKKFRSRATSRRESLKYSTLPISCLQN